MASTRRSAARPSGSDSKSQRRRERPDPPVLIAGGTAPRASRPANLVPWYYGTTSTARRICHMKGSALRAFVAALLLAGTTSFPARADAPPDERVHTSERFAFTAQARYAEVFPLFGALQEMAWAPGWNPDFVWPRPATDCAGMVFHIAQGGRVATWLATAF